MALPSVDGIAGTHSVILLKYPKYVIFGLVAKMCILNHASQCRWNAVLRSRDPTILNIWSFKVQDNGAKHGKGTTCFRTQQYLKNNTPSVSSLSCTGSKLDRKLHLIISISSCEENHWSAWIPVYSNLIPDPNEHQPDSKSPSSSTACAGEGWAQWGRCSVLFYTCPDVQRK